MQYYPQHYYGFAVDDDVAEKLELNEAFNTYQNDTPLSLNQYRN